MHLGEITSAIKSACYIVLRKQKRAGAAEQWDQEERQLGPSKVKMWVGNFLIFVLFVQ